MHGIALISFAHWSKDVIVVYLEGAQSAKFCMASYYSMQVNTTVSSPALQSHSGPPEQNRDDVLQNGTPPRCNHKVLG